MPQVLVHSVSAACRRILGIDATAAQTKGSLAVVLLAYMKHNEQPCAFPHCCYLISAVCRRILGIDATAAQTMGSLAMVLRRMGVELVITRVANRSIRRLLVAHGIISASSGAGEPQVCLKCYCCICGASMAFAGSTIYTTLRLYTAPSATAAAAAAAEKPRRRRPLGRHK
jgi:hypothetical protein